ncbi:DUF3558 domain-containing protein [Mycobacteroides chelonae]|jgi:Protein of unknown function (DUF3558)|uniref:DUF3558 domain-containing protein n=1 Tax=Mycobacteroides chelonae TaxID=1774 RepID=UPI0008A94186|nr:DUF3558 domain-containing protein [Mycobacteroides chelonae]OHU29540.1 hypothetical protein BKG78_22985 [Mycobacteroides chelonae]
MLRVTVLASLVVALAGCSGPISGSPVTSSGTAVAPQPSTNTAGRVHITFDPCKDIPASVIAELELDAKPPRSDTQTDGEIENVFCKYYPKAPHYLLTVAASNYTLDMLKKSNNEWGYQEFEIDGRKMLFGYRSPQPETNSCALNVSATTGVYGVLAVGVHNDFSPFPDCMTAVRKNMEGLLPYFPQ